MHQAFAINNNVTTTSNINMKPNLQIQQPEKNSQCQSQVLGQMPPPQSTSSPKKHETKHSKEDVDAGNTLLIFLKELRKNHDQALAMSANDDRDKQNSSQISAQINASTNAPTNINKNVNTTFSNDDIGNRSVSTAGLVSETSDNSGYNNQNFGHSPLSRDIKSIYVKQGESINSGSSNESGYNDTSSSEEDLKLNPHPKRFGPVRKRFRSEESTSNNFHTM